jgi:DNA-directed RNA polymerase subunit omega
MPANLRRKNMRDDYLFKARQVIDDPYILVNVVSRRVKQLRRGARPLVESLEKLSTEDIALREIFEGKISYELAEIAEVIPAQRKPVVQPIRTGTSLAAK